MLPHPTHKPLGGGQNKEQGLLASENLPEQSLIVFPLLSTCYQSTFRNVYTKFTLLLAVVFEKNHFHGNLQFFFPWVWNALPGRFSEEGQEEVAERWLSRAGCVRLAASRHSDQQCFVT